MTNILDKISDFLIKQFAYIYYACTAIECIEDVIKDGRCMRANALLTTLDKLYDHLDKTEVV